MPVSSASKSLPASSLPWVWIIEYLASRKEVDTSLLNDLIARTPDFLDPSAKNAREMVSLRCLEALSASGNSRDVPPYLDSKIEINLSQQCEDVIQRIVRQVPVSNLKIDGPDLLKWDLQPFIKHKRTSLPKCALQKLQDAIAGGSHSSPVSMKGMGQPVCGDHVVFNASRSNIDTNDTSTQTLEDKGKSVLPVSENVKGLSSETALNGKLSPSKRDSMDNGGETHPISKKLKQNSPCVGLNEVSPCEKEISAVSSGKTVQSTGEERLDTAQGFQAGCSVKSQHNDCCLTKLGNDGDVDNKSGNNLHLIPFVNREVHRDASRNGHFESITNDEAQADGEPPNRIPHNITATVFQSGCSLGTQPDDLASANRNNLQVVPFVNIIQQDASGNQHRRDMLNGESQDDGDPQYNIQKNIIGDQDRKASVHNLSQNPQNASPPDGLCGTNISDEVKNGMDPFVVPDTSSDSDGYHDEEFHIARKKQHFISQCIFNLESSKTAGLTGMDLCIKCKKDGQLLACNSSSCSLMVHEHCLGSSGSFDDQGKFVCPFCAYSHAIGEYFEAKKKASLGRKALAAFIGLQYKQEKRKLFKKLHRKEKSQIIKNGHTDEIVTNGGDLVKTVIDNYGSVNASREDIQEAVNSAPCKPCVVPEGKVGEKVKRDHVSAMKAAAGEASEEEIDTSSDGHYAMRNRRQEKHYTYPAIPLPRRKKVAWSKGEEDMLKEGVHKFSRANDKIIPWTQILEFGESVFQKGRTAIDLKDKWRNICKGKSKSK